MKITAGLALLPMLGTAAARGQEADSPALLVLHKGDRTMAIVDPTSGKVVGRLQTTARDPHELVVSADGRLAVAGNYSGDPQAGNSLSVIDIAGRTEKARVDLGPLSRPHGLWFAGGKFYFTVDPTAPSHSPLTSSAARRSSPTSPRRRSRRVKVGRAASGILIPPDGSRAFVAATGENTIPVIDLKSLEEVARYNTGAGPDGMAWLPGK